MNKKRNQIQSSIKLSHWMWINEKRDREKKDEKY